MNHFEELLKLPQIFREIYEGSLEENPNDYCYWDVWYETWRESDDHLRNRLKEELKKKQMKKGDSLVRVHPRQAAFLNTIGWKYVEPVKPEPRRPND